VGKSGESTSNLVNNNEKELMSLFSLRDECVVKEFLVLNDVMWETVWQTDN